MLMVIPLLMLMVMAMANAIVMTIAFKAPTSKTPRLPIVVMAKNVNR